MTNSERTRAFTKRVQTTLVDFSLARGLSRTAPQASSNFIAKKEHGDWTEKLVTRAIKEVLI